jgi:nucleotide-binding universal stress UspA family protein
MFRKILVAFDGSEAGGRAFASALDLARKFQAELLLLSIIEDLPRYAEESMTGVDEMLEQGQRHYATLQRELIAQAQQAGLKITGLVRPGHVVETVVTVAEREKADLIVLGGEGHTRTFRRVASFTGVQIAHHAHCAVLIMR